VPTDPVIAPTLNATYIHGTQVKLDWGHPRGGDGDYTIFLYRSTDPSVPTDDDPIATSEGVGPHTDSAGLSAGVTYYYRLLVADSEAANALSNIVSVVLDEIAVTAFADHNVTPPQSEVNSVPRQVRTIEVAPSTFTSPKMTSHQGSVTVEFVNPYSDGTIYWTMAGRDPRTYDNKYTGPFVVKNNPSGGPNVTIRARVFRRNGFKSPVVKVLLNIKSA
jgi:hypothetical protein